MYNVYDIFVCNFFLKGDITPCATGSGVGITTVTLPQLFSFIRHTAYTCFSVFDQFRTTNNKSSARKNYFFYRSSCCNFPFFHRQAFFQKGNVDKSEARRGRSIPLVGGLFICQLYRLLYRKKKVKSELY